MRDEPERRGPADDRVNSGPEGLKRKPDDKPEKAPRPVEDVERPAIPEKTVRPARS